VIEMAECVIWTVNINKRKSRREGRKIPRRLSVPNVKLSEMVSACKELGIECRAEEKRYPRCWWEDGGRIIVEKREPKTKLMIKIAGKISELREEKEKGKEKGRERGREKSKKEKSKKKKKKR
jgi:signal recognition particle subunit SRP19